MGLGLGNRASAVRVRVRITLGGLGLGLGVGLRLGLGLGLALGLGVELWLGLGLGLGLGLELGLGLWLGYSERGTWACGQGAERMPWRMERRQHREEDSKVLRARAPAVNRGTSEGRGGGHRKGGGRRRRQRISQNICGLGARISHTPGWKAGGLSLGRKAVG